MVNGEWSMVNLPAGRQVVKYLNEKIEIKNQKPSVAMKLRY
jgi:hypothetical protein